MIFKVAGCANRMAANDFQNKGGKSIGLVVLFLLSLLSPLLMNPADAPSLDETRRGRLQWPVYAGFGLRS